MTYKEFIAQAAIQIFANNHTEPDGSSQQYIDNCIEGEAIMAVKMAKVLAKKIEDDWWTNSDRTTVFFDPADQPNSGVENELSGVKEAINSLKESL